MIELSLLESVVNKSQTIGSQISDIKDESLAQYNNKSRLGCTTLVEDSIMLLPPGTQQAIMQTALSLYCAEYMTAVSSMAKVNDVSAISIIERFSTEKETLANYVIDGLEDISTVSSVFTGLEAKDPDSENKRTSAKVDVVDADKYANLAVGKLLNVNLTINGATLPIQVTARLYPQILRPASLLHILSYLNKDVSWIGRFHDWRSGAITTLDYLTALDIIREKRRAIVGDTTNLLQRMEANRSKSKINRILTKGLASNKNNASGIIVITHETAKSLEIAVRGKLSSKRVRDDIFEKTSAMIMMVVDPSLETIKVYMHSVNDDQTLSYDDIKSASKNANAIDINDVMRAYSKSTLPSM